MNKKKYCVYDNPATMCREAYIDGSKVAWIVAEQIKPWSGIHTQFVSLVMFGAWKTGQIIGDKDAMTGGNSG